MSDYTETFVDFYTNLFGVRRSIIYHTMRRRLFESLHTISTALTLISGSAAFAGATQQRPQLALWAAAVVMVLSALDLVIGFNRRALIHTDLAQRFAQLEREMVEHEREEAIPRDVERTFIVRRLEIEQAEPPVLTIVNLLAHNELVRGKYTQGKYYVIGFWARLVGRFIEFDPTRIIARGGKDWAEIEPSS